MKNVIVLFTLFTLALFLFNRARVLDEHDRDVVIDRYVCNGVIVEILLPSGDELDSACKSIVY